MGPNWNCQFRKVGYCNGNPSQFFKQDKEVGNNLIMITSWIVCQRLFDDSNVFPKQLFYDHQLDANVHFMMIHGTKVFPKPYAVYSGHHF
jgi:hypothetical protein